MADQHQPAEPAGSGATVEALRSLQDLIDRVRQGTSLQTEVRNVLRNPENSTMAQGLMTETVALRRRLEAVEEQLRTELTRTRVLETAARITRRRRGERERLRDEEAAEELRSLLALAEQADNDIVPQRLPPLSPVHINEEPTEDEMIANRAKVERLYYLTHYPASKNFSHDENESAESFEREIYGSNVFRDHSHMTADLVKKLMINEYTGGPDWNRTVTFGVYEWMMENLTRDLLFIASKIPEYPTPPPSYITPDSDTECSICAFPFNNEKAQVSIGSCSHTFHRHCLKKWIQQDPEGRTCPFCRGHITELYTPLWRKTLRANGESYPPGGLMLCAWFKGGAWAVMSWGFRVPSQQTEGKWDLRAVPMEAEEEALAFETLGVAQGGSKRQRVQAGKAPWVRLYYQHNWDPITRTLL